MAKKKKEAVQEQDTRTDFRDAAYKEIYANFRTDVEEKKRLFLDKKENQGKRLTAETERMLLIPYLDKHGFDTLEKISAEALLMSSKKSNQSKNVRDCIFALCNAIVIKYNSMMATNETTEETKSAEATLESKERKD